MSLLVRCRCGHITRARSDLAGKQLACPLCGRSCNVPTEESQDEPKLTLGMRLCTRCRNPMTPLDTQYYVILADDQSQSLLKLGVRRREEMQALIHLLTSHIDVDVERRNPLRKSP